LPLPFVVIPREARGCLSRCVKGLLFISFFLAHSLPPLQRVREAAYGLAEMLPPLASAVRPPQLLPFVVILSGARRCLSRAVEGSAVGFHNMRNGKGRSRFFDCDTLSLFASEPQHRARLRSE
jgi:hypothetical protein